MHFIIESVLVGQIVRFTDNGETSAIAKTAVEDSRAVRTLGIAGDAQADLTVHGGPDKAIHHYPRDHYHWWAEKLPNCALLDQVGAFGENISTSGLLETDACLGDRFRLGTALVEICQGRQPCWKQAHRLSDKRVVAMMVRSGFSGWYYRVIEEGHVAGGDPLSLVARPHPEWSVARVTALLIGGEARNDRSGVRVLASLGVLAEGWRARALSLAG